MYRAWIISIAAALMALPVFTQAADGFVPLIGLPGITDSANSTQAYFDAIYKFSIIAAAFLAVIKIIFAGVQYMITDLVNSKEQAKKDIQGALLGLLIVLGAVLILNTINPNLTEFTLFKDVPTPISRVTVVDEGGDAKCRPNENLVKTAANDPGKCVLKPTPFSPTPAQREQLEKMEKEAIENGEFKSVVKRYDLNEFDGKTPDGRRDTVTAWADECEGTDTETGFLFTELEDVAAGVIKYICVVP